MTHSYLKEIEQELAYGAEKKEHPFHYFTLGTVGLERISRLRTVVLRGIEDDNTLIFYTDARSKKTIHILENNMVGLLFFHPEKLLQVRIEGLAFIHKDEQTLKKYWNKIHAKARKEYSTAAAPGTAMEHPDQLEYLNEENHFCIISVVPYRIEYLKLQAPNHIRVLFSREEDLWTSEYLVP
ncbi:MAG: pyridoxamine 5'-phosphate oxidase family protein [Eudoraea sp.]|nr:pyridoxamine 5'-phosphate oxidase family protein [Eudoraea sp.]